MAHAQKPDFFFRRKGRVHWNRQGSQFSRLLAAEVCASAEVMLDTQSSEVVWRVQATHSIRQFPLHFPSPPVRHRVPTRFNWTLPQNMWRYRRYVVQTDVVISGCDCNSKKLFLSCREFLFICDLFNDTDRYWRSNYWI